MVGNRLHVGILERLQRTEINNAPGYDHLRAE
jgi:hypothetical protein